MPDPAADPPPAPPPTPHGCWIVGGLMLSGVLGMAGAVGAIAFDPPPWVPFVVFFGTPALYVLGLVVLAVRRVRRYGYGPDVTPEQAAAAPIVLPLVGAFFVVAVLAFGAAFAAVRLNAPGWAVPVVFFAPGVVFVLVALPYLRTLGERLKRAAPSPERAAAAKAAPAPRAAAGATTPDELPTVPDDSSYPGRTLARRLPPDGVSAGCALLGLLAVAAFWNGIVGVFVWQAVAGFRRGNPEWFLVVFLIPFVLVGLALVAAVLVGFLGWVIELFTGTVVVEVDAHPFAPGGTYRGHVSNRGLLRLRAVEVDLACEEKATYMAGTSESTDTKVVANAAAELSDPAAVAPLDFALVVPADAMHSFEAAKNAVRWKVRVSFRVFGFVPHTLAFTAVVRPGAGDAE